MSKFTKERNNHLKYSVLISIMLHMTFIMISSLYIKKDELNITKENKSDMISVGLITSEDSFSQKSGQSSISSVQEKLNNIKMLEKVPVISSQKSGQSSISSVQEKLNNIKMLEKVPVISSQKSGQSSISSVQEKRAVSYAIKKTAQKNNHNKKTSHPHEYDVNNLLNKLTNRKHVLKLNNDITVQIQKKLREDNKNTIKEDAEKKTYEINLYKEMLIQSISENFYDNPNYSGKQCILNANLLLDGTLGNIKSSDNYSSLCHDAISAVKLVKLPPPPNLKIYEIFKNITLDFSP